MQISSSFELEIKALHDRTKLRVAEFKNCEAEIISLLEEMDSRKGFLILGYTSLFEYCVSGLKLSESQASAFIGVSRLSKNVPELKSKIAEGKITVSKAKRLTGVIHFGNKDHWLTLAEVLPYRELEKEIAKRHPQAFSYEKKEFLSKEVVKVTVAIHPEVLGNLEKIKDLMGTSDMNTVLDRLVSEYLKRNDPVQKARRIIQRSKTPKQQNLKDVSPERSPSASASASANPKLHSARNVESGSGHQSSLQQSIRMIRTRIPNQTRHQLVLQANGSCQFVRKDRSNCRNKRWLHVHHRKHVAQGGGNELQNLQILCSAHHRLVHGPFVK